eukprot:880962-Rhodomonas_salina.5
MPGPELAVGAAASTWLCADDKNVVAVHCQVGQRRPKSNMRASVGRAGSMCAVSDTRQDLTWAQ